MRSTPIVAGISRDLVGVYSDHFGHEPTTAKTFWWEGIVVCLLGDVFSGYELVLVEAGGLGQVQANRAILRSTFEPLLRGVVEQATGARVVACLGDVSAGDRPPRSSCWSHRPLRPATRDRPSGATSRACPRRRRAGATSRSIFQILEYGMPPR